MRKIFSLLLKAAGVILVGALGSGAWERILAPAWTMLMSYIARVFSEFSNSYENSIYILAANDVTNMKSVLLSMMILYCLGLLGIYYVVQTPLLKMSENNFWGKFLYKGNKVLIFVISMTFIVVSLRNFSKIEAAIDVKEDSIKTFEILRPYIPCNQYYMCRSLFFSMQSKQDFEKLVKYTSGLRTDVKIPLNKYGK